VQASGGRGLLGGLTFTGQADVTNLAAAHAGASGAARIGLVGGAGPRQRAVGRQARRIGREVRHRLRRTRSLLGARPRLSAQGALQGRRLSLVRASLDGAALHASSAGWLSEDGKLSFKLDWKAQGPFRAGPVEIAGAASGNGAITGALGAPRADLIADIAAIDLPRLPLKPRT